MPSPAPRTALVLGGARSGKSRFAETIIARTGLPATYLATAERRDGEMSARIDAHRDRRGDQWTTIEEPLDVAARISTLAGPGLVLLVDCLTLWLSNHMLAEHDLEVEFSRLLQVLAGPNGPWFVVANEVGFGIVPENALARRFRDAAGQLNQRVAAIADRVLLMVAGIPVKVK